MLNESPSDLTLLATRDAIILQSFRAVLSVSLSSTQLLTQGGKTTIHVCFQK